MLYEWFEVEDTSWSALGLYALFSIIAVLAGRFYVEVWRAESSMQYRGPNSTSWLLGAAGEVMEALKEQRYGLLMRTWLEEYGAGECGGVYQFRMGSHLNTRIAGLAAVKHVTSTYAEALYVAPGTGTGVGSVARYGLLGMPDGEQVQRHRRILTPLLSQCIVNDYCSIVRDGLDVLLTKLDCSHKYALQGKPHVRVIPFCINNGFTALTFDVIGRVLFGFDFGVLEQCEAPEFSSSASNSPHVKAMGVLQEMSLRTALSSSWAVHDPRHSGPFKDSLKLFHALIKDMMTAEKKAGDNDADLLTRLVQCEDPATGGSAGLSERELLDEMCTLLIAGHESTANTCVWATILLAQHPTIQDRLYKEMSSFLAERKKEEFEFEDAMECEYLVAVLWETLRLRPTVPRLSTRYCAVDILMLDGRVIPKHTRLEIDLLNSNIDEEYWGPTAGEFNPARFLNKKQPVDFKNVFLPFGHGQRSCVGAHLAQREVCLVIAALFRKFSVSLPPKTQTPVDVTPVQRSTLGVRQDVFVLLTERVD
jgi:cytochrome P450